MQNKNNSSIASVLLIEDEELLREIIEETLKEEKLHVLCASDEASAKELITKNNFDLIISDLRIPSLKNGFQLLEYLKNSKPTPTIITTGHANNEETNKIYEFGVKGLLIKPFPQNDLVSLVHKILGEKNKAA